MTGQAGRSPTRADTLLLRLLLLALGLTATLSPIRSYDYWWHLKTGELILQQGAVPRTDPYSFTAAGTDWVDHEWLFQVLLVPGHYVLGPGLLVLLKAAAVLGLCLLALRFLRHEGHGPAGASVLLLLALLGSSFRLDVRPELMTLLILPLVVHLAIRARDTGRAAPLASIVILTMLGANLHVGVVLVPIVLAVGLGATVLRSVVLSRRDPATAALDRVFAPRLLLATLAAALAVGANPYGFRIYAVPFELARLLQSLPLQNQEWIRPLPGQFPLFFAAAGLALAILLAGLRYADPIAAPALVMSMLLASLHLRHIGLFFLLLPYGLARPSRGLVEALKATRLYGRLTRGESVRPGFITASVLLVSGVPLLIWLSPAPLTLGIGLAADNNPALAADFLEREKIGRRLFNDVRFGGYLIWRRFPAEQVFIDGRNEIYPGLLRDIGEALDTPERWKALIDRHQIDAAFLRYPPTLQKVMYRPRSGGAMRAGERAFSAAYFPVAEWALVYWDDDAMVFLRRGKEHEERIRRLEYRAIHPDDWKYLWAGVLIQRIPVGPILAELQRKMDEDPSCRRAADLMTTFAPFAAAENPATSAGG